MFLTDLCEPVLAFLVQVLALSLSYLTTYDLLELGVTFKLGGIAHLFVE